MKKQILFLCLALGVLKMNAQVVFCPPGAEWNYSFLRYNLTSNPEFDNVPIKYIHDSIIGGDTAHVLTHDRYFTGPNTFISSNPLFITLIKQHGDTVFMRNVFTHHEWQILYNFACQAGQCWQTKISMGPLTASNVPVYTFCVDSVKYIQHNGQNLKTLFIGPYLRVTERFRASTYLFPFDYSNLSDGDYCSDFLCYKDNVIGTKQFTSKPCDYVNFTGLTSPDSESESFQLFPNPFTKKLSIRLQSPETSSFYQISIRSVLGNVLLYETAISDISQDVQIDLSEYSAGIYFVQLFENKTLLSTQKVIKNDQ